MLHEISPSDMVSSFSGTACAANLHSYERPACDSGVMLPTCDAPSVGQFPTSDLIGGDMCSAESDCNCSTMSNLSPHGAELESTQVQPLDAGAFTCKRTRLASESDGGSVDLIRVVKQLPISWSGSNHDDFLELHKDAKKNPWLDLAVVQNLNFVGYAIACQPLGAYKVYKDASERWSASSFATGNDLFHWVANHKFPSEWLRREAMLRPIMKQTAQAIARLHTLGIAHGSISLESILLTLDCEAAPPVVQLMDFGRATVGRQNTFRGAVYQAPETHQNSFPNPFPCDIFAFGVVLFTAALAQYPWWSTKPRACKKYEYARKHGFQAFMARLKLSKQSASSILSEVLQELLESLLNSDPVDRSVAVSMARASWMLQNPDA